MSKKVRHILGLSGGKDSTALAFLLREEIPDMEYFFCDTGKELEETYNYLKRIEARLRIKIHYLADKRGFDHWLDVFGGLLPSPKMRWCTTQLKIVPIEQFVGDDEAVSYIGIRADENREGYISTKPNIKAVFPFKERGIDINGVHKILEQSGIGLPGYYSWRSRSGCYFCFFQRKYEWVMLAEKHPDLFEKAVKYEQEHKDGRNYTWVQGETLIQLVSRKDQVVAEHQKSEIRKKAKMKDAPNRPLYSVLEEILDEEDDELPCTVCHV